MSKQNKRRCGNCIWWKPELTEKGNPRTRTPGDCGFEVEWPALPQVYRFFRPPYPQAAWAKDGADCPCFQEGKPGTGESKQLRGLCIAVPYIDR